MSRDLIAITLTIAVLAAMMALVVFGLPIVG
jgi:hypothetical protein